MKALELHAYEGPGKHEGRFGVAPLVEHNREIFELWLITHAQKLSTRPPQHPDEYHGRAGKRGSQPGQDPTWIEAVSSPDCRATEAYLRKVVRDLERWEGEAHAVLQKVFMGNSADESLPETWRKEIDEIVERRGQGKPKKGDRERLERNRWLLHYLEDAFVFVLYRCHRDRRVLYWPSPDSAFSYASGMERKKRIARTTYFDAVGEGVKSGEAARMAQEASRASRRSVYYWISGHVAPGREEDDAEETA